MSATAYLLVRLRTDGRRPKVEDVGIFSEKHPSVFDDRQCYAELMNIQVSGDFQDAKEAILEKVKDEPWWQWTLPYLGLAPSKLTRRILKRSIRLARRRA